ncbi:RBPJ-interacting and tubulin-associated protein 1 [Apteryx mantelli]|uniref:RBPJ-interacting and tubulin-associated protein 1 n=1 Tax=Apteryx mantelli TaxID=2696672 RepID=A0ABM4FD71_9AVES
MSAAVASSPAPQAQLKSRSRRRAKARPSYVDETLFGSPARARPAPPDFAPPWGDEAGPTRPLVWSPPAAGAGWKAEAVAPSACAPQGTPRRRNKYRLKSHTPSYCDESLFGTKPEDPAWAASWMKKEDVAKLHALLWSPSSAPRNQSSLSSRSKETPLRAVHPGAPASPALANLGTDRKGKSYIWKRPESDSDSEGRGAPNRGRSQSLTRLNGSPDSLRLASGNPKTEKHKNQGPPTAPATPRGPLMRVRSKSVSAPSSARNSKALGVCKPKPPWK